MLLCEIISGSTTADTPAIISVTKNTNSNVQIDNSKIIFKERGVYELIGIATVTSTAAGDYGLCLNANGAPISEHCVNLATGADETTTIPLYGIVEISKCPLNEFAIASLMPVGTPTIVGGNLSVKRLS